MIWGINSHVCMQQLVMGMCHSAALCAAVPGDIAGGLLTWRVGLPLNMAPFWGTLNRNMHAPGQWLASIGVISTPSMVVGVSKGMGQMRCAGMPMSLMSSVAVTGVQKIVPLLKLLLRPAVA